MEKSSDIYKKRKRRRKKKSVREKERKSEIFRKLEENIEKRDEEGSGARKREKVKGRGTRRVQNL